MLVRDEKDIAGAKEYIEKSLKPSARKDTGAAHLLIIAEELLLYLLYSGKTDISVLKKGIISQCIEIRVKGERDYFFDGSGHGSEINTDAELSRNILLGYIGYIDYSWQNGSNYYRIYRNTEASPDLKDELLSYYSKAAHAEKKAAFGAIRAVIKKRPFKVFLYMMVKALKHISALMIVVYSSNMIDAAINMRSFFVADVGFNFLAAAGALFLNLLLAWVDNRYYLFDVRVLEAAVKLALVEKLQTLSMKYHVNTSSGMILSKLISDVQNLKILLQEQLTSIYHLLIDIFFMLIITLCRMPVMLFFFAAAFPLYALLIRHYMLPINDAKLRLRKKTEMSNVSFTEMLSMEALTRFQGQHGTERRSITKSVHGVQQAAIFYDKHQLMLNSVGFGTVQALRVICLSISVFFVIKGHITVGSVVLFQTVFDMIVNGIQRVLDSMPLIVQCCDSISSIDEILMEKDIEKNGTRRLPLPVRGEIEFKDVCFSYKNDEANVALVFENLSFHIRPGEMAAFIGRSGTGKSTILSLVAGIYSIKSGRILIDGIDIEELEKNSFRRHISYVPQNPILFSGTLWDNLTYGLTGVSAEAALDALSRAGLSEFSSEGKNVLEMQIIENGGNLSGGQRQRISLARALLRKASILMLDEITSALDTESEQAVSETIDSLRGSYTILMVAHRLNTVKNADQVFDLDLYHGSGSGDE